MSSHRILWTLLLVWAGLARATEITAVSFSQSTDGSKLVTVHYTLSGDTSTIWLDLSLDGGATFQRLHQGTSGAIGLDVPPGSHSILVDLAELGHPATATAQFRVVATDMNMVLIPAGQFMMGQAGVATPEHEVTLTNDFLLGCAEVTNAQYLEALNWAQALGLVSVVGDMSSSTA
jgi:formylglycine-generating enzyme required for sulfatase activity